MDEERAAQDEAYRKAFPNWFCTGYWAAGEPITIEVDEIEMDRARANVQAVVEDRVHMLFEEYWHRPIPRTQIRFEWTRKHPKTNH